MCLYHLYFDMNYPKKKKHAFWKDIYLRANTFLFFFCLRQLASILRNFKEVKNGHGSNAAYN